MKRILIAAACAAAMTPAAMVGLAWLQFSRLERSIVEKMDQYYLNLSEPGREEYLLEEDEVFEVPYMASKLSAEAQPTRILDAQDRLIGEFSAEKALYVRRAEDLPLLLKKAIVAVEDARFYEHRGIDWRGLARAMLVNLRSLRKKQGGSTITQQLAKLMFTTRKKTYGRKIFEAFCARKLESKFTKDQLLLMYFNFVYFGHGCFGVESAARYFFSKPASQLSMAEAALLAGIINNPSRFSPFDSQELSRKRHHVVLSRMAKHGALPAVSVDRYWGQFWAEREENLVRPEASFWRMNVNNSPYLVEYVRRGLEKEFSRERIVKGGLVVRTTFDLELQKAAEAAMREGLRPRTVSTGTPPVEGGLAALRPADGALLALVGGRGFDFSNQLIRAADIARPIGSTVKPFIFAAAFEAGKFKPEDTLIDAPLKFKLPGGRTWEPKNYGGKYFGEVTLRQALERSLNSAAIQVLQRCDLSAVLDLLSKASGAPRERFPRELVLALGAADLSPVQLAAAYAVFPNGGTAVTPHYLRSIEDRNGQALRPALPVPPGERLLAPATAAVMVDLMRGVFRPGGTAHGPAARLGFAVESAGKTGTTSDYRDAWFAGFTPDLSAAVWIGHDDMRVALGEGATGGGIAAPIWMDFVTRAYRARPTRRFELPEPKS